MIDNLSLALTHGLMLLAAWLLLKRTDLDSEAPPPRHWRARGNPPQNPPEDDRPGA
ncbi:hypothetical protein [Sphingomonas sp. 2SG]|uniref:hypothetical protein n=1 Tax=Sphingomonas sp. 2SG TaxID=2502201 RepID=UPI001484E185|nr:hypothetical protein [Sphingomonas sp. 2SG]